METMTELTNDNTADFLSRFYQFYDTVIRKLEVNFEFHRERSSATVWIATRDSQGSPNQGWVLVKIVIEDITEMRCTEGNITYTVLSQALHVDFIDNVVYLDFGALLDLDNPDEMKYSVEDFRQSEFYIAGRKVLWDVLPYVEQIK